MFDFSMFRLAYNIINLVNFAIKANEWNKKYVEVWYKKYIEYIRSVARASIIQPMIALVRGIRGD